MTTTAVRRIIFVAFGLALLLTSRVWGQAPLTSSASPGDPEEELFDQVDDEETSAHLSELLSWLHENPIDLNLAQREELLLIPGLTGEEADALLRRRENKGKFTSLNEIRGLPGGEEILAHIRPYVALREVGRRTTSGQGTTVALSSRLSGFLPGTTTIPEPGSLGNPAKSLTRLSLRLSRSVRAGLLFEKDAGEMAHDGFSSGYIALHGNGAIEQFVLGDFNVEAGQGLVLSRITPMIRSSDVVGATRRPSARLLPNHVPDEAHYLRGAAIALRARPWSVPLRFLLIASRTSLAANINEEEGSVTSFYSTGLYRTAKELAKRNAVHEALIGSRIECRYPGRGALGLTYYHSAFDRVVQPSSPLNFAGKRSEVFGGDFSVTLAPAMFFGEAARTANGGTACIAGLVLPIDSTLKASITYRNYAAAFDNPHGSAYGVQTSSSNERGLCIGWEVRLPGNLTLHGTIDQCKIPESTYNTLLPRTASTFLVEMNAAPVSGIRLSLAHKRGRAESMQANPERSTARTKVLQSRDKASVRFTAWVKVSPCLETRTRIEHVEFWFAGSRRHDLGNLTSQTFRYRAEEFDLECGAVFYEADSFDARLYDYEGNVRGGVQSPMLFGKGSRWHLVFAWEPLPWVRLAGKYAVMLAERKPVTRELGVQAEVRF